MNSNTDSHPLGQGPFLPHSITQLAPKCLECDQKFPVNRPQPESDRLASYLRFTVISVIAYTGWEMEIRVSRNAKNKLRLYKLAAVDVEQAINVGDRQNQGDRRESRYGNLRVTRVKVGPYALVVTVIRTR